MSAVRESPVLSILHSAEVPLALVHGMWSATELGHESAPLPVGLADASCLRRIGVKGPKAERWLAERGVIAPRAVNTFGRTANDLIVARLGRAEFFLEDRLFGTRVDTLEGALSPGPDLYPVPRQDAALVLFGERADDVLAQTTNYDFRGLCRDANRVVSTSMAGVSVLMLGYESAGIARYRIWCDPSFGPYLCRTLLEIVREEGGEASALVAALGLPSPLSRLAGPAAGQSTPPSVGLEKHTP